MPKMKLELTEQEIKEAVKMWAVQQINYPPEFKTVTINISENRDASDRLPGLGYTVTATVSE